MSSGMWAAAAGALLGSSYPATEGFRGSWRRMKEGLLKLVTHKVWWIARGTAAVERAWVLVVQIADK